MVQSTVVNNGAEFKICRRRGIYEKEFVNDEVPDLHHQMLVMVARIYPPFLLALVVGKILRRTNLWPCASWAYLDNDDDW